MVEAGGTPAYRIDGNRVITERGEMRLPHRISRVLEFGDSLYVRMDVPRDVVCNENVWHIWLPGPTGWFIDSRPYGMTWCPYVDLTRRNNIAVCLGADGHVVELCGRNVVVDFSKWEGPPFLVSQNTITFKFGRTVNFSEDVAETLRCGEDIVLRTDFKGAQRESLRSNLWVVGKNGDNPWAVPAWKPPLINDPFVWMKRVGRLVEARTTSTRVVYIDPGARKIVREEVDQSK